jgi:hypothetical protein
MIVATALAIALFGHPRAQPVVTRQYRKDHWNLTVVSDGFTGKTTCSIHARHVVIHRNTAIFSLGGGVDTNAVEIRIDGAGARSAADLAAENARNGVFPERGWVENPSGGDVAVPLSLMRGARHVYIRASQTGKIRTFTVGPLDYVLQSAAAFGCPAATL